MKQKNKYFNCTLPNLLKTDPKRFWNVVNPKQDRLVPSMLGADGNVLTLDQCAEQFNMHFAGVYTDEDPINSSLILPQPAIPFSFPSIIITSNGVKRAIDRLPFKTSPGPDGISAKLLKLTSHISAIALSLIFQQSLDSGYVPEDWKIAHVLPIPKSGDNTVFNNYRPISLTSISCKLLEHIIYTHIMAHLNRNNLLINNQHGFRPKLSCQTQLYELVTDIHTSLHLSHFVDGIFIDFSKAFDRVPHKRLTLKLRNLELDCETTRWLEEFLKNRSQVVKLNDYISRPTLVKSGVPQGTVIGPLLFLIYINDIASNINSTIRLFADDCVIYREIAGPNDVIALQSDLHKLTQWCSIWQMQINLEKTKHLTFNSVLKSHCNTYILNDKIVDSVTTVKYLGVFINSRLTWTDHIEHITCKAQKKLGFLKRRLYLADRDTRLQAYNFLVRPSLEYASIIWHPHQITLTNLLEAVQNKAARFILSSYSRFQSVSSLKAELNMPPLAVRRQFSRLSFFHTLYHSNTSFARTHILPPPHTSNRTDHAFKVNPIFARTEKFKNSPLTLSIKEWNDLPSRIATIAEPSLFNSALLTYLEPGDFH